MKLPPAGELSVQEKLAHYKTLCVGDDSGWPVTHAQLILLALQP